ncbi:hypothetical protein [Clostridium lundense]|uniref:hypothetical protein n=1 Tax=Clostridium lundense TaxID=319475 RepID=UPI0004800688|nr:hypothetical protein [Clostridium lundense]
MLKKIVELLNIDKFHLIFIIIFLIIITLSYFVDKPYSLGLLACYIMAIYSFIKVIDIHHNAKITTIKLFILLMVLIVLPTMSLFRNQYIQKELYDIFSKIY